MKGSENAWNPENKCDQQWSNYCPVYWHVAILVLYYTILKYLTKVYESFIENQNW